MTLLRTREVTIFVATQWRIRDFRHELHGEAFLPMRFSLTWRPSGSGISISMGCIGFPWNDIWIASCRRQRIRLWSLAGDSARTYPQETAPNGTFG
jgi:hypothetical protein